MIKLTEKHLRKLSIVTGLPLEKVCELDAMGLLNEERTIDLLMRHDWKLLKRARAKVPVRYRIKAVANEYGVSDYRVKLCITARHEKRYFCKECGVEISRLEYVRNKGLCEDCTIKSIKL